MPVGGHISDIRFGMPGDPVKIAKLAVGDTDIRGVHVPVDLPGNLAVGHLFFPEFIRDEHQVGQGGVLIQENTLFYRQKAQRGGFFI